MKSTKLFWISVLYVFFPLLLSIKICFIQTNKNPPVKTCAPDQRTSFWFLVPHDVLHCAVYFHLQGLVSVGVALSTV